MKKKLINILIGCFIFLLIPMNVSAETIIAIDPGHGGSNQGADYLVKTKADILEKDMTLQLAILLKKELEMYPEVNVVLLRNTDVDISLAERAEQASEMNAKFIVSLHFNASEEHQYYGTEIWVSAQKDYYVNSYVLAQNIEDELMSLGLNSRGIKTRLNQTNTADYYGLIREGTKRKINTLIVEHCFVDHQRDKEFWSTSESLKKLAEADAKGIITYLDSTSLPDFPIQSTDWIKPDTTPPQIVDISLASVTENNLAIRLQVEEHESKLCYYTYSYDHGTTWADLCPVNQDDCILEIPRKIDAQSVIFKIYNGYDLYSLSDSIAIPVLEESFVTGDAKELIYVGLEHNRRQIDMACTAFLIVVLTLLIVHIFIKCILLLRNGMEMRFWCLILKKFSIKAMQKDSFDISSYIRKNFCTDTIKETPLFWYTKIHSIDSHIGIENVCLDSNQIKAVCKERILRVTKNQELQVDNLLQIFNQITAFEYTMANWSSLLTIDFLEKVYQILTVNLWQENNDTKEYFVKISEKAQRLSVKKENLFNIINCDDWNDLDYFLELYQYIIYEFGSSNKSSYTLASLIIFKECIRNEVSPFFVDSQSAYNILCGSSNRKISEDALRELFYEQQVKYIKIVMRLIS